MKYQKFILAILVSLATFLSAEIIEIDRLEKISPYISENAICLLDIDDTLIDNPTSLGTPRWRSWIRPKLTNYRPDLFDDLTLFIAKKAPYKTVEATTVQFVADLQNRGVTVLAFTARGRTEWYTTDIEGLDLFTEATTAARRY